MLRRTQPITVKAEEKTETDGRRKDASGTGPFGVDRRRDPRLKFDELGAETANVQAPPQAGEQRNKARAKPQVNEPDQGAPVFVERRKAEREKMEAMRAGLQRSAAAKVEERGFGSILQRAPGRRFSLKPSRIVLLLVALVTGGLAAFLATQLNQPAATPVAEIAAPAAEAKIVAEPRVKILVARKAIGIGQRLLPAVVEWKDWPQGELRPDYITFASMAQATGDMSSEVSRFEIFPGEPIRRQKLVSADQGYLSAIIERGLRAVSVSITPLSASGGFIVPNDHVDVVLTRDPPNGQVSQTILSNIRVLAINSRLGETGATGAPADPNDPRAEMFADQAIATLELDPSQAEVIISATTLGRISLVLRSMSDFAQADKADQSGPNQAIRITSPFWNKALEQVRLQ
ncbi:Flp pilus assembly protein RcpC/CpaB [hydrothermal vent metagenome]|uniref:Flp pilus assembly protein RcpC/CpaB n=1 Tax=hydrothermal vent metagenome TaxID=652676 RepID=A0A3B0U814_9ZZZZ